MEAPLYDFDTSTTRIVTQVGGALKSSMSASMASPRSSAIPSSIWVASAHSLGAVTSASSRDCRGTQRLCSRTRSSTSDGSSSRRADNRVLLCSWYREGLRPWLSAEENRSAHSTPQLIIVTRSRNIVESHSSCKQSTAQTCGSGQHIPSAVVAVHPTRS